MYFGENDRVPPNKFFGIPKGAERGAAVPLSAARVERREKNILQHATTGPLIMLGTTVAVIIGSDYAKYACGICWREILKTYPKTSYIGENDRVPPNKNFGIPKGAERGAAVPLSAARVERREKNILQHATTGPLIMLGTTVAVIIGSDYAKYACGICWREILKTYPKTSYIGENDRVPPNKNFGIPKGAERGAAVPLSATRVERRKKHPPACNHPATHHAGEKNL